MIFEDDSGSLAGDDVVKPKKRRSKSKSSKDRSSKKSKSAKVFQLQMCLYVSILLGFIEFGVLLGKLQMPILFSFGLGCCMFFCFIIFVRF